MTTLKEHEVRVRNWVQTVTGYHRISAISESGATFYRYDGYKYDPNGVAYGWGEIYPVQLTTKLLLKIGFDKCTCGGYCVSGLHISKDYKYRETNIKYLHELQNLFFALNNEELIIDKV